MVDPNFWDDDEHAPDDATEDDDAWGLRIFRERYRNHSPIYYNGKGNGTQAVPSIHEDIGSHRITLTRPTRTEFQVQWGQTFDLTPPAARPQGRRNSFSYRQQQASPHERALDQKGDWTCDSQEQLIIRLGVIEYLIIKETIDKLIEVASPDYFIPNHATLVCLKRDLRAIAPDEVLLTEAAERYADTNLTVANWQPSAKRPNSYVVPLLHKGEVAGQVFLAWNNCSWKYGFNCSGNAQDLAKQAKHQAPATFGLSDLDLAKKAALRLLFRKVCLDP